MINSFPLIYEDEILYSALARLHQRSAFQSGDVTLGKVFGKNTIIPVVDFPGNLSILSERVNRLYSPEFLLHKTTLFPFYQPFISKENVRKVYSYMLGNQNTLVYPALGLLRSNVKKPRELKYCSECIIADKIRYGEPYWHRVHQLPSVFVCPMHEVFLIESNFLSNHLFNKKTFHVLDAEVCSTSSEKLINTESSHAHMLFIAQQAYWILQNEVNPLDLKLLREQYISLLIDTGEASAKGILHYNKITKSFKEYFGQALLNKLQCSIDSSKTYSWLQSTLLNYSQRFHHPIYHLLIMRYLEKEVVDFAENKGDLLKGHYPFGRGNWPCLNIASEHYLKHVVDDLTISRCENTKRPIATFTCGCGFIYTRHGPDLNEEMKYTKHSIKTFGVVWEQKLVTLSKDHTYVEIAKLLNADRHTVSSYLRKILNEQGADDCTDIDNSKLNTDIKRNEWLELQVQYPMVIRSQLRLKNKSLHSWLYKHDKTWLDEHSPPLIVRDYPSSLDWKGRDKDFSDKIIYKVIEFFSEILKPIRISKTRLGKVLGIAHILENHINRLPCCKRILEDVIETKEDFRMRRMIIVADRLRESGKLVKWRLAKEANIPEKFINIVEEYLLLH